MLSSLSILLQSHGLCPIPINMLPINITTVYAIALGTIVFALIFVRALCCLAPLKSVVSVLFLKHLYYPYLLDRHRLIGP